MKTATITRDKSFPAPGRAAKFAWKWIYTIDFGEILPQVGQRTATHDTLGSARASCKRLGFKHIEAWKGEAK
jgi:hypothetical protein